MRPVLRVTSLLLIFLVTLAACTTPAAVTPSPTSTLSARQQAIEAVPSDRVELASGHYQLLMFYSPL